MEKIHYTANYTVTIGDLNYGAHLGNDKALLIFHDARIQMLENFGLSELNIGEDKGIIMVEAQVKYLRQVGLHAPLSIDMQVLIENNKKFEVLYEVKNKQSGKTVISGSTTMLCFAYDEQKVKQLPESFIQLFTANKEDF